MDIITADLRNKNYTVPVYGLVQWDYGQILQVTGLDLQGDVEVHFSLQDTGGSALVVTAAVENGALTAPIPNIYLAQESRGDYRIYAFIYTEDDAGGHTVRKIVMLVSARPKPDDYVYTETEVFSYKALADRVSALEENGGGGIAEENDPTVPVWAKEPEKPTYTAQEVGALPDTTKLADLEQDANNRLVTDKEKELWNGKSDFSGDYNDLQNKPTFPVQSVNGKTGDVELNATDVGAYGSGAGAALEESVTKNTNDIRKLSEGKISTPATGSTNQILAVKTVDSSGKPSEFECVDKPTTPVIPTALKNPHALKFTGAVTGSYDGSEEVTVDIPQGNSYTLPIATADTLGGVKPVAKTDAMTQEVGVDSEGKLYTESGGGEVADEYRTITPIPSSLFSTNSHIQKKYEFLYSGNSVISDTSKNAHNAFATWIKVNNTNYVFATWIEYADNTDYAHGGSCCNQVYAIFSNPVTTLLTGLPAYSKLEKVHSDILFIGKTVDEKTISDASDATIFRVSDTELIIMAYCTEAGSTTQFPITAHLAISYDTETSAFTVDTEYFTPNFDGADYSTLESFGNGQFNNQPLYVDATIGWVLPINTYEKGVDLYSTLDGVTYTKLFRVPCEHTHCESALLYIDASNRFTIAIRSAYNDSHLYVLSGLYKDGEITFYDKIKIPFLGASRPWAILGTNQKLGGSINPMYFYMICTNNMRDTNYVLRICARGNYGSGYITDCEFVQNWDCLAIQYPSFASSKNFNSSIGINLPPMFVIGTNRTKKQIEYILVGFDSYVPAYGNYTYKYLNESITL